MKSLIHTLCQMVLLLGLANIVMLLVPKCIRKSIKGTFKLAYRITHFTVIQLTKVGKNVYANYKEIEQPKKRSSKKKQSIDSDKVIQFPKANVK